MSKHTPGPWKVRDWRIFNNFNEAEPDSGPPIKLLGYTATNNAGRTAEAAANARLMGSAPDLVAASDKARAFLEEISSMLPTTHDHQCMEIITALEDAIQSATT